MQKDLNEAQQKGQENPNRQDQDQNKQGEEKKEKISSKVKYQLMKKANGQFQRFFDKYLEDALTCPIGQCLMTDPVVVSSGHTFDRINILDSIRIRGPKCPVTREPLKSGEIISNMSVKSLLKEYQQFLKNQKSEQQMLKKFKLKNSNRITIVEYQQMYTRLEIDYKKKRLGNFLDNSDHSIRKVQMGDFLKCDWSLFEEMDLTFCQISDEAIQLFMRHGKQKFKNIYELDLSSNKITTISQLQRLPKLRRLNLEFNPLTSQAKSYLKDINEKKGRLRVKF